MYVLVTVPHGFCEKNPPQRMCDTRAASGVRLFTALLDQHGLDHKIIHCHVPRALVDVNREKPTLVTIKNKNDLADAIKVWDKFNNRIASTIQQKKTESIFLVDVHSFPKGSFGQAQIAILDILKQKRPELQQLANQVRLDLGLNVQLLKGGTNYIQNQYQADAYPLLIEFCEDKTYLSDKALKAFWKLLVEFYAGNNPLIES
jgi:hypothetical protein